MKIWSSSSISRWEWINCQLRKCKTSISKSIPNFKRTRFFNYLYNQISSPFFTPAVQSELVTLLQSFQIWQALPIRDNSFYQSNHANANIQDQNSRFLFHWGIDCHNCHQENHYHTSYNRLVVSVTQYKANRTAMVELQERSHHYPWKLGIKLGPSLVSAVPSAVASSGREGK